MQFALLGYALGEQLLQLRHTQCGVALGYRNYLAGIELGQFALVLAGLAWRVTELLLERGELLVTVFLVA
ncbi:hypothetical protein D3C77_635950 [compost metagenome]